MASLTDRIASHSFETRHLEEKNVISAKTKELMLDEKISGIWFLLLVDAQNEFEFLDGLRSGEMFNIDDGLKQTTAQERYPLKAPSRWNLMCTATQKSNARSNQ